MIVAGLTGSIGMGKSTVASILRDMGVPVHCADEEVHTLLAPGGQGVMPVAHLFPDAYDKEKSCIDRKKLGVAVFDNPEKRRALEEILHPLVQEGQQKFLRLAQRRHAKVAVLDIPLLFETGAEARVDVTLCVSAPPFVQRQRVLARPGMNAERFEAIRAVQMSDNEKRRRADFVIPTGGGLALTRRALRQTLRILKDEAKRI